MDASQAPGRPALRPVAKTPTLTDRLSDTLAGKTSEIEGMKDYLSLSLSLSLMPNA